MDRIEKCVELFLARNYSFKKPLILALSGGVDSSVLCAVLRKVKNRREFDLRVLHIDHSWRKESREQALFLQQQLKKWQIPFLLYTLDSPKTNRNLEEKARNERLAIFEQVAKEAQAEAILVAHHQDDLAETMLKRVFESTPFPFWSAIEEITTFPEMVLWRPLLEVSKKEIISYATKNQITYLTDSTSEDNRFLRNRMRKTLIPDLESSFGKAIGSALANLRDQSIALKDYLKQRTQIFYELLDETAEGIMLDLKNLPAAPFEYELTFFITDLCRKKGFSLSGAQKQKIAYLLMKGDQEGTFATSDLKVIVRGKKAYFSSLNPERVLL